MVMSGVFPWSGGLSNFVTVNGGTEPVLLPTMHGGHVYDHGLNIPELSIKCQPNLAFCYV